jgi:hypothetical protein
MRTRASATDPYTTPLAIPLRTCSTNSCISQNPR